MKIKTCGNSGYNSYKVPPAGTTMKIPRINYPSFSARNREMCMSYDSIISKNMRLAERIRYKNWV